MASNEIYRHHRIDPVTGEESWFYPMEITAPTVRESARRQGLAVGKSRLGFRVFDAVMIPCKDTIIEKGKEVFIPTPAEKQRRRYLEYIKAEMADQEKTKQDTRCEISDGNGCLKRCPCRIPNPDYTPGNGQPKTLPVECAGCKYELFKNAHSVIPLSELDSEDETGEKASFEPTAQNPYDTAWMYLKLRDEFLRYTEMHNQKLTELASLLTLEYTKSEASRTLDTPTSTIGSRTEKLKELVTEFLDTVISL